MPLEQTLLFVFKDSKQIGDRTHLKFFYSLCKTIYYLDVVFVNYFYRVVFS